MDAVIARLAAGPAEPAALRAALDEAGTLFGKRLDEAGALSGERHG
ncbi:hypothetical protein [Spongiactinospora gelatinilytica]|nr:hypothetical protein [Spongiactinospora gelatinilytica]